MRSDLREICQIEINRIKSKQMVEPLTKEDVEILQKVVSSLKTLEDSGTPETDNVADILKATSTEDLFRILDEIE